MSLIRLAVDIIANLNPLKQGMDQAVQQGVKQGEAVGDKIAGGLQNALSRRMAGGGLAYAIAESSGGAISAGVGMAVARGGLALGRMAVTTAGTYQRLQLGFEAVLGDAAKAKALMDTLKQQGAQTPFRTEDLSRFAQQLLFTGVNAKRLKDDMQALEDVTAARGGTTEDMGQIVDVLRGLRTRPRLNQEELHPLTAMMDLQKVYQAGAVNPVKTRNVAEAAAQLSGMTGENAYDTLIRGIQKVYGGSAARLQNALLDAQIQQAQENLSLALEPTGNTLTAAIKPVVSGLGDAAQAFGNLNKATGGTAGVLLIVGAIGTGLATMVPAGWAAVRSIRDLTSSIAGLAVASKTAAGQMGGPGAGAATRGGIMGFGGAMLAVEGAQLIATGAASAVQWMHDKEKSAGSDVARANWAAARHSIGLALSGIPGFSGGAFIGNYAADKAEREAKKSEADKAKESLDKNTEALGQNTKTLQDMAFSVLGGGARTSATASLLEREYAGSLLRGIA